MSAEAAPLPTDKLIGQTLASRYQIETRLGEGAMGAVYRAKHVKVGRPFAVKVLHAKLLQDRKVAQRFEREAELAGRLRHPNVIGVVDVGETPDGLRYMVMDFAEGRDLASLLDEAPMPAQRIIHLTRQMLEGLYHAHEAGLIHRDFKPENVIIERDAHGEEVPRIVDFGIAILREGGESATSEGRLTTNGLVLGTPHYMAPEQAVADPIDHRIDLFALGIVIYEMLCGKLPFDGTGAEVARANLLVDPPAISQRVPYLEVDPLLEAFSRRLMAKKRDHRPATAKAARELLDLIEKDTAAAAAALGVPHHASSRTPAVTQPDAPPLNRLGTSPPDPTFPRPTDLEAPPVSRGSAQRDVPTSVTNPIGWTAENPPQSKRRLWIAAALGLAAVGGIVTLVVSTGKKDAKAAPEEPRIVLQALPPAPTPVPTPTPPTHAVETAVTPTPTPTPIDVKPTGTKPTGTKPAGTRPTGTKPHNVPHGEVKAPEIVKTTTPTPTPTPTPTSTSTAVTAAALASQYGSIGRELKALQDKQGSEATAELWPRYRMININDAISTPEKRAAASAMLARIGTEIARKK